jgi:hypothetical protein
MTKQEFITFLKDTAKEKEHIIHWKRIYDNSDDFWKLYKPFMDWLEDDMDLSKEDVVIISYNKSLYDNDSAKEFRTTYEDFVKNYDKTLG